MSEYKSGRKPYTCSATIEGKIDVMYIRGQVPAFLLGFRRRCWGALAQLGMLWVCLMALGSSGSLVAQYWTEDTAFRPMLEAAQEGGGDARGMAFPGGKFLHTTSNLILNGQAVDDWLIRFKSDGTLDSTFNVSVPAGRLLAVYPDGRILLATTGVERRTIKRLLSDGSLDDSFTAPLINSSYFQTLILPDEHILVYGEFTQVQGQNRTGLVRLGTDGSLDAAFAPLLSDHARVHHVRPTYDGQHLMVVGSTLGLGAGGMNKIARLNMDGSLDVGFDASLVEFSYSLSKCYPAPDGSLLVAEGGVIRKRLDANGSLLSGFVDARLPSNPVLFGESQPDGRIFYIRRFVANVTSQSELRRMNADGSDDETFTPITTPESSSYHVGLPVIDRDGSFYLGATTAERSAAGQSITHFSAEGILNPSFDPKLGHFVRPQWSVRQPDGKYLVSGQFDRVGGIATPAAKDLIRLNSDGSLDESFVASLDPKETITRILVQPTGNILIGGTLKDGQNFRRLQPTGEVDASFTSLPATLANIEIDYLGRIFGETSGTSIQLKRYSADGVEDASFHSPVFANFIDYIAPLTNGKVLGAERISGGHKIFRLLPDGSVDAAFPSMTVGSLIGLLSLPDDKAMIASVQTLSTTPPHYVLMERLNAEGGTDFYATTGAFYGTAFGQEVKLAMAWILHNVLKEYDQLSMVAQFPGSFARMMINYQSGGQVSLQLEGSWVGGNYYLGRYVVDEDESPGFTLSPVILQTHPPRSLLWPLNHSFGVSLTVGGISPFSFQWAKDGDPIPGQTSSTLSVGPLTAADAGKYTVTVSNLYGSVISAPIALTVDTAHAAPLIQTQPKDHLVERGGSVTLSVEATANPAPAYQWMHNAIDIPNAVGPTLLLENVQPAQTGGYAVRVSNTVVNASGSNQHLAASRTALVLLSQVIDFPSLMHRSFTGESISLMATTNSGLQVGFTVLSGPATLSGNLLTLSGVGTVTLQASQAGDETYAAATPVDRSFVVTGNYASWLSDHFTSGELGEPSITGPNAVYGQDGLPNLVKYALGLDPKVDATNSLPEVTATPSNWVYTYTRPSSVTDVTYQVEVSTDLITWTTEGVVHSRTDEGLTETWQATYPVSLAANLYFRLKITESE